MNRIFGRGKPKAPPANLSDCIGTVSTVRLRGSVVYVSIRGLTVSFPCYSVMVTTGQGNQQTALVSTRTTVNK